MHGEDLVVGLGAEHVAAGPGQLRPHDQRLHAGQEEEGEGRVDVAHADTLVVDGGEEAGQAGGVLPHLLVELDGGRGHRRLSR